MQANAILKEQLKVTLMTNIYFDSSFKNTCFICFPLFQLKPDGVWFLFFKGRLELVQAHVDEAIHWYEKSWQSQNLLPQFHHLCFWELTWAYR